MYIFIDEAGGFQETTRSSQVSCVAALVVPEAFLGTFVRKIKKVTKPWREGNREVKGSTLNESQVSEFVRTIRRFDVLLCVVAIDMGLHSASAANAHRTTQVSNILKAINPQTPASLRPKFQELASQTQALSDQLYIQSTLLTRLVHTTIREATLYYAQRIPCALGRFSWRVDAKDRTLTAYESLWRDIVKPSVQSQSLRKPMDQLIGADYSHLEPYLGKMETPPEHLKPHIADSDKPFHYLDINAVLQDLRFCQSENNLGVQAVDILASAVRRACNGHLQRPGWRDLGRLMPGPERGSYAVRFVAFAPVDEQSTPYTGILDAWRKDTKRMIVTSH